LHRWWRHCTWQPCVIRRRKTVVTKLEELSVLRCGKVIANSEPNLVSESKSRSTGIPNGEVFLEPRHGSRLQNTVDCLPTARLWPTQHNIRPRCWLDDKSELGLNCYLTLHIHQTHKWFHLFWPAEGSTKRAWAEEVKREKCINGYRTSLATSRSSTATVGSELNVVFGILGRLHYCKAGSKLRVCTVVKVKVKVSCYAPCRHTGKKQMYSIHIRSRH